MINFTIECIIIKDWIKNRLRYIIEKFFILWNMCETFHRTSVFDIILVMPREEQSFHKQNKKMLIIWIFQYKLDNPTVCELSVLSFFNNCVREKDCFYLQ